MPKKLDRCVKKLMEEGHDEDSAWAICQSSINKTKKGVKMLKKAIVLKSMRTAAGANDWVRLMNKKYPGAKVVDSDTLKSYDDFGMIGMPEPFDPVPGASHVVIEEDLSPIITVIKKGDASDIIKVMVQKGFMEVDQYGPCMTSKWHDLLNDFMSKALKESLKSVETNSYEVNDELNAVANFVINALDNVRKALEDSEKMGQMLESGEVATENDEFGHALRPNKPISEGEASGAFENDAAAADTRDPAMDGEAVSDSEVDSATHKGDHNAGKEVLAQPSNSARKSVQELDDYLYLTFKSVDEARAWKNPDVGVYQVVPVESKEKRLFGADAKYVVRGRYEWYEHSLKSAHSTEADDRTQGLTEPEDVSDDGGTDAVEARASQVDSKKSVVDETTLKSVVSEIVDEVLE